MLFYKLVLRLPLFEADGGAGAGAGGGGAGGGAGAGAGGGGAGGGAGAGAGGGGAGGGDNAAVSLARQIIADYDVKNPKGGAPAGGNPAGGNPAGGNPAGAGYRPEGLPDHLFGKDDKETIEKLHGAYKPLRDQMAQRGETPKAAGEYKIEIPEASRKAIFGDGDPMKDPAVKIWAEVAHAHGFTHKEFNVFGAFFEKLQQANLLDPKIDPKAEIGKLGDDLKASEADVVKREAAGARRILDVNTWLQGLETRKVLDQAERETLAALTTTAHGVRIIEKLSKLGTGGGVQNPGGDVPNGGQAQATELEKRLEAMYPSMRRAS